MEQAIAQDWRKYDSPMTIEEIHTLCHDDTMEITQHMMSRFQQRGIRYREIKEALQHGEIIEDYPDDFPYPSCIVLGATITGKILHVVVGIGDGKLWIITAYEPDASRWSKDFRVRKEENPS